MRKWGLEVEEVSFPYEVDPIVASIWTTHEGDLYWCKENKTFYVKEWGKRKPIRLESVDEVIKYYMQFAMEEVN